MQYLYKNLHSEMEWNEKEKKKALYKEKVNWDFIELDMSFKKEKFKKDFKIQIEYETKNFQRRRNSKHGKRSIY